MTAQTLYLAMILAASSSFMGLLGLVSLCARFPQASLGLARAARQARARHPLPVLA